MSVVACDSEYLWILDDAASNIFCRCLQHGFANIFCFDVKAAEWLQIAPKTMIFIMISFFL